MGKTRRNLLSLIGATCCFVPVASAQTAAIANVGKTVDHMDAIAFSGNGLLYGATSGSGALYTIHSKIGAAALVHALVGASNPSLTYGVTGLAFQPGNGQGQGRCSLRDFEPDFPEHAEPRWLR